MFDFYFSNLTTNNVCNALRFVERNERTKRNNELWTRKTTKCNIHPQLSSIMARLRNCVKICMKITAMNTAKLIL